MAPFAYICLSSLPSDPAALNQIASGMSLEAYARLQNDLKIALSQISSNTTTTSNEDILRQAWSNILRVPIEHIEPNDNFFRLGGDSVLAMKLAAHLRGQGYGLTVADIFRYMKLNDAAEVMTVTEIAKEMVHVYKPFSTLQVEDAKAFVEESVKPKFSDAAWAIKDVAPVTDSQALDVRATINAPRTSYQYTMLFMDRIVDSDRLLRSCSELVRMHDILRTVFIEHESNFLQVVVENLVLPVMLKKTTEVNLEQYVKNICNVRAEESFELDKPFAEFIHVEGVDGKHALIIGLSHAQYDGVSLPNLLRDLDALYTDGETPKSEPYLQYVSRVSDSNLQKKAAEYWTSLLKDSSMSTLVGETTKSTDKALFQHRAANVTCKPQEITTSSLLTAAWAVVLARRLQKKDVTFGSITSGRNLDRSFLEDVQGPCYAFTPVRVLFQEGWHAKHLLEFVQKQAAESAAFDSLGYSKIAKAVGWEETSFFDSIVHHQDWDDFDTMPFAGSEVKVDILNPHGDASHPLKVVSFVKAGETHVGVVGSERDPVFIDKVLDELVLCVEELAVGHDVSILT
jgi:aryl carrier-like protein